MTLQEIQERYFEITDDWAAEDPKQQWTSVAELDDLLHELEDVDQPDTPAVRELRERIEALMDEIENHRDMQLVAIADDPTGGAQVGPNHIFAGDGLPIYSTVSDQSATRR